MSSSIRMDTGRNSQNNYKNMHTTFRDSYRAPSEFAVTKTGEAEKEEAQVQRNGSQMTNRTFKERLLKLEVSRDKPKARVRNGVTQKS